MTQRRHLPSTIVVLGLLVCASAIHARTAVDLASEGAPSIHGTSAEEQFGYCTAVGDLDGDGLAELVVGAPGLEDSAGTAHAGAVFVFRVSTLGALSGDAAANCAMARKMGVAIHEELDAAALAAQRLRAALADVTVSADDCDFA